MKWYDKEISPKISSITGFGLISVLLIICFVQYRNDSKKLANCSIYTVAKITGIYTLRGQSRVEYQYTLGSETVKEDKGVNNDDTNESWTVDLKKLSKRRLLLQIYCNDINVHRILWDVSIPDTLQVIPAQGWKELPFVRAN